MSLLVSFALMGAGGFALGTVLRPGYPRTTTLALSAAGNNVEPAIAVAIASCVATSGQAFAGVGRPLIEVLALGALVYPSIALRRRLGTSGLPREARAADRR